MSPGENWGEVPWRSGNLGVSGDDSHLFFLPARLTDWFGGCPISDR